MSKCKNLDTLFSKVKNLENDINNILLTIEKPEVTQLIKETFSIPLEYQSNDDEIFTYSTENSQNIFDVELDSKSHDILDIKVSASFMVMTENLNFGSVVMGMRINDTLVTENETLLTNKGFQHLTLNYSQSVQSDSIYNVERICEGLITTNSILTEIPILNIRNNGTSLSILLL